MEKTITDIPITELLISLNLEDLPNNNVNNNANNDTGDDVDGIIKGIENLNITGKENAVKNGKKYELLNNLNIEDIKDLGYIDISKKKFLKYLKEHDLLNLDIKHAHGCKEPDECYINTNNKKIYIIEKKFQTVKGSVCEKLQTVMFKKWHFESLIKGYEIIYIYCLSSWFYKNCIRELEYLDLNNIYHFNGNGNDYKEKLLNYIIKNDEII